MKSRVFRAIFGFRTIFGELAAMGSDIKSGWPTIRRIIVNFFIWVVLVASFGAALISSALFLNLHYEQNASYALDPIKDKIFSSSFFGMPVIAAIFIMLWLRKKMALKIAAACGLALILGMWFLENDYGQFARRALHPIKDEIFFSFLFGMPVIAATFIMLWLRKRMPLQIAVIPALILVAFFATWWRLAYLEKDAQETAAWEAKMKPVFDQLGRNTPVFILPDVPLNAQELEIYKAFRRKWDKIIKDKSLTNDHRATASSNAMDDFFRKQCDHVEKTGGRWKWPAWNCEWSRDPVKN